MSYTRLTQTVLTCAAAGLAACTSTSAKSDVPNPNATTVEVMPPIPVTSPRPVTDVMGNTLSNGEPQAETGDTNSAEDSDSKN